MKVRDVQHAVLPQATAEERSRQEAVVALRRLLNSKVRPRNVERYVEEAQPAFVEAYGRMPQSPEDVQRAFLMAPGYRRWSAANRAAQEMIWVSVGEPVYRDLDRMKKAAADLIGSPEKRGSLTLDPGYDPSPEVADVDIHLQPGGYAMNSDDQDVVAMCRPRDLAVWRSESAARDPPEFHPTRLQSSPRASRAAQDAAAGRVSYMARWRRPTLPARTDGGK